MEHTTRMVVIPEYVYFLYSDISYQRIVCSIDVGVCIIDVCNVGVFNIDVCDVSVCNIDVDVASV